MITVKNYKEKTKGIDFSKLPDALQNSNEKFDTLAQFYGKNPSITKVIDLYLKQLNKVVKDTGTKQKAKKPEKTKVSKKTETKKDEKLFKNFSKKEPKKPFKNFGKKEAKKDKEKKLRKMKRIIKRQSKRLKILV